MSGALALLSGGVDSTVALALQLNAGREVATLAVDYGQRHGRELGNAKAIAAHYGVPHQVLDLTDWGRQVSSALTRFDVEIPHGHYASPAMRSTVVPNRNATLLMAAAGIAASRHCESVVIAVHSGDFPVYADCRPEFIAAANTTIGWATDGEVRVDAPFLKLDKAGIVRAGAELNVPFGFTWSCYEGGNLHCGQCGACVERAEAFSEAEVSDPTTYLVMA